MNMSTLTRRVVSALSLGLLLFSFEAQAWQACQTIFSQQYPASQTDENGSCQTCHETPGLGAFNVYGTDLFSNGAQGAGFNCDAVDFVASLIAVESFDSDQEGNSNIAEIEASTQPGWCDATASASCVNSGGTPPNTQLDPVPQNAAPMADAGGPYSGEAGTTLIRFDGSGSSDPEDDPLTYAWDFGDGTTADGVMPTHTYATAGSFQVTLVVNDGMSDSDPGFASAGITEPVANLAPTADPGGPYTGEPGVAVVFDGSGSTDPNDDPLTFAWDFGDGGMGDGVEPSHVYAADGTYSVTLTVNDGQIDSPPVTTTVEIATPPANRAPVADAGGPYSGETASPIAFDGSGSSDPDGDALTYAWDFGDGMTGDGAMPSHSYEVAGTYTVALVVSDGEFQSDATATVEVTDPVEQSEGEALYNANCLGCHADPWDGPAVDETLPGLRRVAGARSCNIYGSIFGTSVFPNGVPEMQFLQGLTEVEIDAMADYLNSRDTSGHRRYVTTCAGCHGNDGSGGRTDEDVHGESAHETWEAIEEESEMRYLACMPASDIESIADFLMGRDDDYDDDGIPDDDDDDDDNDGINDDEDDDDDNDGVSDDDEYENGTDPRDDDTDDDGLDDGEEREHGTDPNDPDSDDDGTSDGAEVLQGTNPLVADIATPDSKSSGGGSTGWLFLAMLALIGRYARSIKR